MTFGTGCICAALLTSLCPQMNSDYTEPLNLGNEGESSITEWASLILDVVDNVIASTKGPPGAFEQPRRRSEPVYLPAITDDPPRRRPDISRAREVLGWSPRWTVQDGLTETVRHFVGRGAGTGVGTGTGRSGEASSSFAANH